MLGYQPGWLWWAIALGLVMIAAAVFQQQFRQYRYNQAYIAQRIEHFANEQGLDVALVAAVVEAESGGDWRAKSSAGAKGLMQVTTIALKDVQDRYDVKGGDLYEVDYNLRVGTLYLKYLLERFEGDVALAVAAYHMGPTELDRGLKAYPDLSSRELISRHAGPQTRAYVDRVLGLYEGA